MHDRSRRTHLERAERRPPGPARVASFHFFITDSHANGDTCANIGTITTTFEDGGVVETDLVMVYTVRADGRVASMTACWEPERAMATYRKG